MLCAAVVLAVCVAAALGNALGAPLCANVVGDGLGVFGSVGSDVIGTDAGEVEGFGVAVVLGKRISMWFRGLRELR